jgi:beta-glucosidase
MRKNVFIICSLACLGITVNAQKSSSQTETEMRLKARELVNKMTLEEKVGQMLYTAPVIQRLGIPEYNWWNECLHGVARAGRATVFPQAVGMAAMWDKNQMFRIADAISDEARAKHHYFVNQGKRNIYQGLTMWTPNINIFRDPRWGRGMETYGEDPYLTGELAVPFIKGLQGNNPDYYKVIATAKHFVVHSGPEVSRHSFNARVDDFDFLTTYTPHFKKTVEKAGVYSVMCAYNRFRGNPCCGDKFLENLLRNEWNFKGYIVSDCWAVKDFYNKDAHEVVNTKAEAAAMAVKAGTDLNCGDSYQALTDAVKQGLITESELDVSVERLMLARLKLGMLTEKDPTPWSNIPLSIIDSEKHKKLALETAQKSMVLLKNKKNILPLQNNIKRIAVIGPNANDVDVLLGNYHGYSDYYSTVLEGVRKRNPNSEVVYAAGSRLAEELPLFDVVPSEFLFVDEKLASNGFNAAYFANKTFMGELVLKRIDKQIDFKWWGKSPDAKLPVDSFSVRWTGVLVPPVSGNYYLGADGHRAYSLFVNDSLITSLNNPHHNRTEYGTLYLEKGKKYRIRLEYMQNKSENAFIKLLWDIPGRDLLAEAVEIAKKSDVVIMAAGLSPLLEGEEMKVKVKGFKEGDRESIDLPDSQKRLIDAISKTGKPIVLVLLNGSAIAFTNEAKKVDAVVEAWYPGQAGGEAIASVLWGDYNPAGRLPVTFYKSVDDLPAFDDYNMKGRTYRYFEGKPQFGFGYGLSFTTFKYSKLQLSDKTLGKDSIVVKFEITNTGKRAGDEVCQLYLQQKGSKAVSLQGFERVNLAKGETKTITMSITSEQLEDMTGQTVDNLTGVEFRLIVGGANPRTKSQKLKSAFFVK